MAPVSTVTCAGPSTTVTCFCGAEPAPRRRANSAPHRRRGGPENRSVPRRSSFHRGRQRRASVNCTGADLAPVTIDNSATSFSWPFAKGTPTVTGQSIEPGGRSAGSSKCSATGAAGSIFCARRLSLPCRPTEMRRRKCRPHAEHAQRADLQQFAARQSGIRFLAQADPRSDAAAVVRSRRSPRKFRAPRAAPDKGIHSSRHSDLDPDRRNSAVLGHYTQPASEAARR